MLAKTEEGKEGSTESKYGNQRMEEQSMDTGFGRAVGSRKPGVV